MDLPELLEVPSDDAVVDSVDRQHSGLDAEQELAESAVDSVLARLHLAVRSLSWAVELDGFAMVLDRRVLVGIVGELVAVLGTQQLSIVQDEIVVFLE